MSHSRIELSPTVIQSLFQIITSEIDVDIEYNDWEKRALPPEEKQQETRIVSPTYSIENETKKSAIISEFLRKIGINDPKSFLFVVKSESAPGMKRIVIRDTEFNKALDDVTLGNMATFIEAKIAEYKDIVKEQKPHHPFSIEMYLLACQTVLTAISNRPQPSPTTLTPR